MWLSLCPLPTTSACDLGWHTPPRCQRILAFAAVNISRAESVAQLRWLCRMHPLQIFPFRNWCGSYERMFKLFTNNFLQIKISLWCTLQFKIITWGMKLMWNTVNHPSKQWNVEQKEDSVMKYVTQNVFIVILRSIHLSLSLFPYYNSISIQFNLLFNSGALSGISSSDHPLASFLPVPSFYSFFSGFHPLFNIVCPFSFSPPYSLSLSLLHTHVCTSKKGRGREADARTRREDESMKASNWDKQMNKRKKGKRGRDREQESAPGNQWGDSHERDYGRWEKRWEAQGGGRNKKPNNEEEEETAVCADRWYFSGLHHTREPPVSTVVNVH